MKKVLLAVAKVLLAVVQVATSPIWLPFVVFVEVCIVGGFCDD